MSKRFLILSVVLAASLAGGAGSLWARGFGGGFHGGGGGFHGGDFGGFHGGDFGGDRGGDFGGYRGYEGGAGREGGWAGDRYGADRAPTRNDLDHFLGLPSDQGFHQLGNRPAANGAMANRDGQWAQQRQNWANGVRNNLNHWNGYNAGWYSDHPGAWAATGWGVGAAWGAATWPALGAWFGSGFGAGSYGGAPVDYDYGNNVAYEGNQLYINGQDVESAGEYYNQVAAQADGGAQADAPSDGQWLPLGVFALGQDDQQDTGAVVQLAVNKQGIIRGNYTDTVSNQTSPVKGAVDEKTQRVAFTIGDNQSTVLETGLYNLTQPEASVLIHFGADKYQQWTLVRLSNSEQAAGSAPAATSAAPAPSDESAD